MTSVMMWPVPFEHVSVWGEAPYLHFHDRPLSFIACDSEQGVPHLFMCVEMNAQARRECFLAVPITPAQASGLQAGALAYRAVCDASSGPCWLLTADYAMNTTLSERRAHDSIPEAWWPEDDEPQEGAA